MYYHYLDLKKQADNYTHTLYQNLILFISNFFLIYKILQRNNVSNLLR